MDFHQVVRSRRTVRDFEDKPIPLETLERIIEAGLCAPSNDHLRRWEFILIPEKARRAELLGFVDAPQTEAGALEIVNQWGMTDPVQRAMYLDGIPKQHRMILNAGCLIIPCFHHVGPLLRPETLSHLNGFASIWLCIENMLLAAAAEGIFGVTRIPFEEERQHLKTALKLPEHYEIPCWLSLGYPQVGLKSIEQIRVCAQERMHFDSW